MNEKETHSGGLTQAVEKALEAIRPMLQAHGGDVQLVAVEARVVKVHLTGTCVGCPFAQLTLQAGIERKLKEEIPEVERVEAV